MKKLLILIAIFAATLQLQAQSPVVRKAHTADKSEKIKNVESKREKSTWKDGIVRNFTEIRRKQPVDTTKNDINRRSKKK